MKVNPFAAAAFIAMVLALGLSLRVFSQNNGFRREVNESLATTEGYDQRFIDLVNHMEEVLAKRASFSYPGGKDPLTGRRREVAAPVAQAAPHRIASAAPAKPKPGAKPAAKADSTFDLPAVPPPDKVKLTAIIADDYGQHTAIVMDGERSMSVDVGDLVGNRKVTKVTAKEISMEDDTAIYTYDIAGNRNYQRK
jgi:hypothetical protein